MSLCISFKTVLPLSLPLDVHAQQVPTPSLGKYLFWACSPQRMLCH